MTPAAAQTGFRRPVPTTGFRVGAMSEKKVVRVVPTFLKRMAAAKNRAVFENEQKEAKARKQVAKEKVKADKRIADGIKKHKSGRARVLIKTAPGQQEIEAASDDEVELEDCIVQEEGSLMEVEEASRPEIPNDVLLSDGSTLGVPAAIDRIMTVLKNAAGYQPLSECLLSTYSGIPLDADSNSHLKTSIYRNPLISVTDCDGGGALYKLDQRIGVECKDDLLDLFRNRLPLGMVKTSNGLDAVAVSDDDLKAAYEGIDCDLDRMISDGEVDVLSTASRDKRNVYFSRAPGVAAPPSLRDLWHSIKIPDETTLRKSLMDANLRTAEEFEARDMRAKERNIQQAKIDEEKKRQEREDRKKPLVGKSIKNLSCTHIMD